MAPAEARTLATDWAGLPQTTSVQHHDFGDGTHPEPELRRKIRLILDQSRALDVDAIPAISGVLLAKLVRLENDLFQADLASSRAFIMLTVTDERQNRIGNLPQLPRYIGSESPPLPAASTERERLMKAASRWPPGYWDRTSIPVNCMPYQLATAVVQVDGLRGDSEGAEIPTLPFPRYTPDCFANGVPRGAQITGRTVSFQVKPMTGNILRLDSVADCGSDRFAGLPASPIRADRYAVPIEKLQDARRDLERIGRLVDWDGGADCDQVLNRERERREALHAERAAAASALEKAPIIRTIVDIEDSILELPISSMTANGSTVHLRVAFTHTPRSTSGDGAR